MQVRDRRLLSGELLARLETDACPLIPQELCKLLFEIIVCLATSRSQIAGLDLDGNPLFDLLSRCLHRFWIWLFRRLHRLCSFGGRLPIDGDDSRRRRHAEHIGFRSWIGIVTARLPDRITAICAVVNVKRVGLGLLVRVHLPLVGVGKLEIVYAQRARDDPVHRVLDVFQVRL